MDYCTKTFLSCYVDAVMGLQGAVRRASNPKQHDPEFWERSAMDWLKQALQNYRHLEREYANASQRA